MSVSRTISVVSLFGALGIGACGDDARPALCPGSPSDGCYVWYPGEPGGFAVGVTTLELVDAKRDRPLKVEVWYPAEESARTLPHAFYTLRDEAPTDLAGQLSTQDIQMPEQDAARDATPERQWAPYPLLTFSHGKNGIRFQNARMMAHLASHGFVVAAPDHTDDTLWELLANTRQRSIATLLLERPKDLSFVAEAVTALTGPLAGMADIHRWGVFGHSFGGTTSIVIAASGSEFFDARVRAILPMTPEVRFADALGAGPKQKQIPMMILAGVADGTLDYEVNQRYGYEIAPAPRGLVSISHAGHFSFTDLCAIDLAALGDVYGIDLESVRGDGCGESFTEPERMRRILDWFGVAFFNAALKGSPPAARDLEWRALPVDLQGDLQVALDGL